MTDLAYATIHEALIEAVPEFQPGLEEHRRDLEEVVPHLLFGDFTRFVTAQRQEGNHDVVARSLAFLEVAAQASDPLVKNVVALSFVENAGPWESGVFDFIAEWSPHLKDMARQQGWPGAS